MPDTLMSEGLQHRAAEDPAILAAAAYLAADRRTYKADQAVDQCDAEAHKLFPEIPESVQRRWGEGHISLMTLYEAAKVSSDADDFGRRAALIAQYNSQKDEMLCRFGVPNLETERDAAIEDERRLMKALRDTRATTAAGMLAKLRIAIGMTEEGMDEEVDPDSLLVAPAMFSSVVADLKCLAGMPVLALSGEAPAADRQLVEAETEVTRLYAGMADCVSDKESNAIIMRAGTLDDYISAAVPSSLADCAVKLRRVLDHEVGMVAGAGDRDVPALAQVLDYIEMLTGAPSHPTRPIARSWDGGDRT